MINQQLGTIKNNQGKIVFEMKDLNPETKISFGYGNVIKKAKVQYENKSVSIEIHVPKKAKDFTLFFNNKPAISYKTN